MSRTTSQLTKRLARRRHRWIVTASGIGSPPDLYRFGKLALHVVGQLPDVLAARVAEIEARLGELRRVAVGPECEERIARV